MEVRRLDPASGLNNLLQNLDRRVGQVETRPQGSTVIQPGNTIIITDPNSGIQTILGTLPDGTTGIQQYVNDTTPPPQPSSPALSSSLSMVTVAWNGLDYLGGGQPKDYDRTVVQVSSDGLTGWVDVAEMRGNDVVHYSGANGGDTVYVRLVSYDLNQNASTPSSTAHIVVVGVVDDSALSARIDSVNQTATAAQATANGKNTIYYQTAAPSGGTYKSGDLWFDTDDNNKLYTYSGSAWVLTQDAAGALTVANGKNQTFIASSAPTAQAVGDIWLDSSNGYRINRWSGSAWVNVQDTAIAAAQTSANNAQTTANGKNTAYYQNSQPTGGTYIKGDLWFDTANSYRLSTYTGSAWQLTQDSANALSTAQGKNQTFISTSAPTASAVGDIWIDSGNGYRMNRWSGSAWVNVQDSAIATAQAAATAAQTTANGKNTIYYQATQPSGGTYIKGDVWFDTANNYRVSTYSGSAWVLTQDAAAALSAANTAQTTASAKNQTFIQGTAPTASAVGDLWMDTSNGNVLKRWSGSAWVNVQDSAIATAQAAATAAQSTANTAQTTANGKNTVYYQNSQPTGGTYKAGDIWFDTANNYRVSTYTGSAWQITQDSAGALTTAQGKNQTFIQGTAPTANATGDLWIDTSNGNLLKRWSGSAWVNVQDTAISTAQTSANNALSVAQGKNVSFIQSTAPTASAVGDLWIDSGNGNVLKRWSGSAWVNVQDSAIATAQAAATAAQSTANGKNTSYYQATQPTGGTYKAGDLWFNTANNFQLSTYSGSAWVLTQDSATALSSSLGASGLAATKGQIWVQSGSPAGGTSYGWSAATNASTSTLYRDASLLRTNLCTYPNFELGSGTVNVRTNLCTNPNAEAGITGWSGNFVTVTSDSTWAANGTKSFKTVPTGGSSASDMRAGGASSFAFGMTAGNTYTVTAVCYLPAAQTGTLDTRARRIVLYSSTDGSTFSQSIAGTQAANAAGATTLSCTITIPSNATGSLILLGNGSNLASDVVYWDSILVEQSPSSGTYFDGSTTAAGDFTYAWASGANASVSYQQAPAVTGWSTRWYGGNGGTGVTYQTKSGISGNAIRKQWITATTAAPNDSGINPTTDIAVTPGATYTASIYSRSSVNANLVPYIAWYDSTNTFISNTSTSNSFALTANVWARGYVTATAPANAATARFIFGPYSGTGAAATMPAGATLDFDQCLIEQVSTLNVYYDGNTASDREYDLWLNTSQGNKAYQWDANSHSWITAQDTAISTAQTTADGKNTVYYAGTAPTGGVYKTNDVWFNTADGNKISYWNGSAWTLSQLGTNAIANLAITNAQIADATIQSAKIGSVDAGTITAGTLSAARIGAGTIAASALAAGAVTASAIAANAIAVGTAAIANGAITNAMIADATIQSAKIGTVDAGTITTGTLSANRIGAGSITGTMIAGDTITAGNIAAGGVTASELAAGSVTASAIAAQSITATALAANSVTATAIAADTITASQIAAGAITSSELAAGSVTAAALTANAVTASAIAANTIVAGNGIVQSLDAGTITAGTLNAARIGAKSITTDKLLVADTDDYVVDPYFYDSTLNGAGTTYLSSNSAVPSAGMPNSVPSVVSVPSGYDFFVGDWFDIQPGDKFYVEGWVTNPTGPGGLNLGIWACDTRQYGGNSSTQAKITTTNSAASASWIKVSGEVTIPSLGSNGPSGQKPPQFGRVWVSPGNTAGWWLTGFHVRRKNAAQLIVDGGITANLIAANSISATALAANAVSATAIAASAIDATKLAAGSITASALAANSVTATAIAANTITATQIATDTITAGQIAAGAITASELAANSVSASALAANSITATAIAANAITASAIAARTIAADKLVITDSTNMVADGDFEQGSSTSIWTYNTYTSLDTSGTNAYTGSNALKITGTGNSQFGNCNNNIIIPMEPNAWYYWEYWYKTTASAVPQYGLRLASAGGSPANSMVVDSIPTTAQTTWTKRSGQFQLPSTVYAASARFDVQTGTATDSVWIDGFKLRRQNGAELIVDGTITATELAASSVTAAKLAAGSITASAIAANSITASALAAGSITASALAANSITATAIAANAITASAIAAGVIDATKLAANSVTATAIAANTITATNGIVQSLDAGVLTAGTLNAARIGAKSITTDKLVITSTDNLINEGTFAANATSWTTGAQYSIDATGSRGGSTAWKIACNGTKLGGYNLPGDIPVTDGQTYRFTTWLKSDAAIPATGVNLYVKTKNTSGVYTENLIASTPAVASATWYQLSGVFTMPANTVAASFGVFTGTNMASGRNVWIDTVFASRMSNGELIVDGSITANSLAASAITAGKISAGAIDGFVINGATINGGVISTTTAAGSAVARMGPSTVKDAINGTNNYYPGNGFGIVGGSTVMAGMYSTDGDGVTVTGGNGGVSGMNYHDFSGNNQTLYSYGGMSITSRSSITVGAGQFGASGAQLELLGPQVYIQNSTPYNGTVGGIQMPDKQYGVSHAEMAITETGVPVTTVWGPGMPGLSTTAGTNQNSIDANSIFHWVSNDHMSLDKTGFYSLYWLANFGSGVTGRTFLSINPNGAGYPYGRNGIMAGEDTGTLAIPSFFAPAGTVIVWNFYHTSSGAQTVNHVLKVRYLGKGIGQF